MPGSEVREYVAFDLETTGLMVETDRVVEIGAVRFDSSGHELGRFERLINPGRPMSPFAQAIHGISDADLAGAFPPSVVLPEFLAFIESPTTTLLLAHNARFDAGFLGRELARLGWPPSSHAVIDTLSLARRRRPDARDHRLDTLARLFSLDPACPHRALADSLRVKGLWIALGGPDEGKDSLVSYPIFHPCRPVHAPNGWEPLTEAIADGLRVRIEYAGGSLGPAPREVTPKKYDHRGGRDFLIAFCHIENFEKSFRLDRVRSYEIVRGEAGVIPEMPVE